MTKRTTSRRTTSTRDDDKKKVARLVADEVAFNERGGTRNSGFLLRERVAPHHVSDEFLCETTACVYLARVVPVSELRKRVRRRFVANEYPSSIERLYAWSPDEAVPQFYDDPSVFSASNRDAESANGAVGLGDLRVPSRRGLGAMTRRRS